MKIEDIQWDDCPGNFREALKRHVEFGIVPGSFLTAVLSNDLFDAMNRADVVSKAQLGELCKFIYFSLPGVAWGSKDQVIFYTKTRREWVVENAN